MRHIALLFALLFLIALVVACSSSHKVAKPDSAPGARVETHSQATNAAAASAPTAGAANPSADTVNQDLVTRGYRPTTYRGQLMYCRTERPTGTMFASKVCLTEQQIKDQERAARDAVSGTQVNKGCNVPGCS